jgi:protein-S-isoprenylcysteine O-methyltransferase Ste14
MTVRDRWITFIHTAATGAKKTRNLLTPVGVIVFGVFTGCFVIGALLVDSALGLPGLLSSGVGFMLSIPVLLLGIGVTAWSVIHFLKVRGTPVPFNPPPNIVDTGPYRYTRNPMLTGVFLILFGLGFALNSISLIFIFTPGYILINWWELKHIEEPELEKRFGDAYIEYQKRTPMFIPRIKNGR